MFSGEDMLCEGEPTVYPVSSTQLPTMRGGIVFIQTEKLTFSRLALPTLAPTQPGSPTQAMPVQPQTSLLNSGS